jgi:hypothetical protein
LPSTNSLRPTNLGRFLESSGTAAKIQGMTRVMEVLPPKGLAIPLVRRLTGWMVDLLTRSWRFHFLICFLLSKFAETVQIWHAGPARDYAFCVSVKR